MEKLEQVRNLKELLTMIVGIQAELFKMATLIANGSVMPEEWENARRSVAQSLHLANEVLKQK